ncbi:HAMP domain-containing histidine kinase [Planosporangium thailandense]|uniref:histidine kinase n=1 Tax=Planosporangium thailandense TaxID=765197 RepID=A0ABX0XTD8_9ACTN|nr:HAMP domain-containing sensor histidine kinase [Planosporangium thailandense]NJC68607.1 HAMP domain-containing histidine kinase [Planosporangium thailandense]
MNPVANRWARLSLRARLSGIAAMAVAIAVLAVGALAWLAVRAELDRQLDAEITADANVIAAAPGQWPPAATPTIPTQRGSEGQDSDDFRARRVIGPRWQIIDRAGAPAKAVLPVLPVTPAARAVAAGRRGAAREEVTVGPLTYRMVTLPAQGGGAVQVAVARDPTDRTLGALGLLLAIGCVAGVAGAALLGRTVARAGLAPVERLTDAVEHVAATQNLQAAIPVSGKDEIARLARSVNAMLAALESSRAAQRALVEDAGHELRTPLTSLRTNIELLIRAEDAGAGRLLPAEDRARLLQDLEVQVVELTQLTNELVELARQDASPEPAEEVDLAHVVEAAVQRARLRAPAVTFETALRRAVVSGRPQALERMVLNLLDNAAKWSPPQATVEVAVSTEAGSVLLTVADAGPGIDDDDLPRIFERFYRATAARSMPGSGLGLAIVAQTVAQHDGTVTAGRAAAGGALFSVRLPADRAVHPVPGPPLPSDQPIRLSADS